MVGAGRSLQQLAGLFWNHTPRMIQTVRNRGFPWPVFTEQELANIISYIQYVKLFDEPGDPTLGELWFRDKRCADCHSVGGRGGSLGPPLDEQARFVAPVALAQSMSNHAPVMQARLAARGTSMPRFAGRELADIQAYIRRASTYRNRQIALLEPPNPENGRVLFTTKGCARCHGRGGQGTAFGPELQTPTERLGTAEIAGNLWNHSARMIAAASSQGVSFPRFEGGELADVIAFLYYLRFDEAEGNLRVGQQLYTQKGCADCHGGEGIAPTAPALGSSAAVRSPLALATAMWGHAPAMYDLTQLANREWPLFEGNEMRDLSAYLHSLASQQPSR
jgi:mono/diheme cytochrome c family protein